MINIFNIIPFGIQIMLHTQCLRSHSSYCQLSYTTQHVCIHTRTMLNVWHSHLWRFIIYSIVIRLDIGYRFCRPTNQYYSFVDQIIVIQWNVSDFFLPFNFGIFYSGKLSISHLHIGWNSLNSIAYDFITGPCQLSTENQSIAVSTQSK